MAIYYIPLVMFLALVTLPLPDTTSYAEDSRASWCNTPFIRQERLVFDGAAMPSGWYHAGDPDLVKLGNQWFMFFTSHTVPAGKLYTLAAALPPGKNLATSVAKWQILRERNGEVLRVIQPGESNGTWDADAIETPKYVEGFDNTRGVRVRRIYYTGWRKFADGSVDYRVGFAFWNGAEWEKYPDPVVTGTHLWERFKWNLASETSVLGDQTVFYVPGPRSDGAGGVWHMWYQSFSGWTGDGIVYTAHATSSDGVVWPLEQREIVYTDPPFASPHPVAPFGPYYQDMFRVRKGGITYYNFLGKIFSTDTARQGLWLTTTTTPDGRGSGDFSFWHPIAFELRSPWWRTGPRASYENGYAGFSGGATVREENGKLWLFYSGFRHPGEGYGPTASIGRAVIRGYLGVPPQGVCRAILNRKVASVS